MDAVREKLIELEKQYNEISDQLISDEVISNPRKITKLSKEQAQLSGSVEAWHELQELDSRIMQAEEMLTEEDPEMKEMAQLELDECVPEREALLEKIQKMLIPRDPEDGNDVIIQDMRRARTGKYRLWKLLFLKLADFLRLYSQSRVQMCIRH